jgi:hypothetical protein
MVAGRTTSGLVAAKSHDERIVMDRLTDAAVGTRETVATRQ